MKPLVLYKSDGTRQTPTDDGVFTLANSTVYYAELFEDPADSKGWSIHYQWNAALVAAITVEKSNRSKEAGKPGGPVTSYAAVGSGWATTSAPTVSAASSAVETFVEYDGDLAFRRRIKIDVTTGGTFSAFEHAKKRGA